MTTEVKEEKKKVQVDLNELLGIPGADNMLHADEEDDNKPGIFAPAGTDVSFIDNEEEEEEEQEESEEDKKKKEEEKKKIIPASSTEVEELLQPEEEEESEEEGDEKKKKKTGRPTLDKEGITGLFKGLIESEDILPFTDDKPIEEYTINDFKELLVENLKTRSERAREQVEQDFFEALPPELQIAAQYVLVDKGDDLKGLFRLLSQAQEVRELDISKSEDQEEIIRQYHRSQPAKLRLTESEIDEEIATLKDQDILKTRAEKFKPKLDDVNGDRIASKLAEQAKIKDSQIKAARAYSDNVHKALKDADINGIKLDKKTQNQLYIGLVQPNFISAFTGKPTNMLGHLLEKYQYSEPDHALIAEALYLLSDPEGYRTKVKEQASQEQVKKTVRQLKTEESKKTTSSPVIEEESKTKKTITRKNNIFQRNV